MIIFRLFLIIPIAKICYTEFMPVFHPFNPVPPPLLPICPLTSHQQLLPLPPQPLLEMPIDRKDSRDNIKFILPFLDIEVQNDRNLHIMQEVQKQQIYILHGHELYQLFINRQEKRLSLVAELAGGVRDVEPLGAKIIYWQSNFLLVIALEEHLEIYELDEHVLLQRAEAVKDSVRASEPPPIFEPIQQLTLTGRFQKLFLFSPAKEHIMIAVVVNFTPLYGKLRIFDWLNTYFNPVEEMTVPNINVMNVIGFETKYLIMGRAIKHQPKTILTVYEISSTSPTLLPQQTLTVESHTVHIFTYLNRNMIVACSNKQQQCKSFRQMPEGHFTVYRRRTYKEFAFNLMTSSTRFVSAIRQNRVMVFTNHRLDCYASFMTDQMDVTNLLGFQNPYKEDYVLLVYKRPFKTLLRIVQLQINSTDSPSARLKEPEEILASNHHQHLFESAIGQLRSVLLQRKMDMDKFRKASQILKPKLKATEVKDSVIVHAGKVGIIKVIGEFLRSPKQVAQKIESLRQNFLPQRAKRSTGQQLFNASLTVSKRAKVQRMIVENLIYHGDVIEGFSLNQTNLQQNILNIKPKVSTRALNTTELILPQQLLRQTPDFIFDSTPPVRVSHLKVDFINGVHWNTFYDSLFLKNRDKVIEGSLMLLTDVNVKDLKTTILNGLVVSKLFNLKYPQVIHSDLLISRILVHDLKANTVNGLNFEEDIVFSGNDTFIETPVKMHHLSISGDLLLANNTIAEHSTAQAGGIEFQQFYTNKIILNGSLIVNNLKRTNNQTKIILGDQEFDEYKIKEKYLLREQDQNFSFPVVFEEAKVTAASLKSNYLNDQPTSQHMLLDKISADKTIMTVFMNAHIMGDVICRGFKSKIAEIKENIIHPGDKVHITGSKKFEAPVQLNSVEVLSLNQLPVKDLVFKTNLKNNNGIQFKDTKTFSAIKVKGRSIVEQELKASYLNNLALESLLNNDYYMERLYVPHFVATTNLVFHKINGIPFDEFFAKLDVRDEKLVLHKDLIVEGNAKFVENLQVNYINDIAWNEYVHNLVRVNENAVVEGDVSFNTDLTITDKFEASEINGYDLEIILKNLLMKNKPQLITGLYSFDNIIGSNLDVSYINNISVAEFVDLSRNFTELEGDIIVEHLNVGQNLQGNWSGLENLLFLKEKINNLLTLTNGKSLYVLNNASWPDSVKDNSQQELLKYLYKSAVKSNEDQIITGTVKISQPLIIDNMQTRTKFPNNLDLEFILQDAVLKNTSVLQIIKAEKVFSNMLNLHTLKVKHNLHTKFLNDIDVARFNLSLYRLTSREPLRAVMKFLRPLTVGHLRLTNGLVNGLNTSVIYQLDPNTAIPYAKIGKLYIENDLFIENINDMNLRYFLDNRVTLKGPAIEHFGVLTFENLVIKKAALIQTINGIAVDELVFKHSPYLQAIKGHKTVEHSLELAGPAHIMRLNDKDLTELHRNCLMKDQNYEFDKLVLQQATFENGLQMFTQQQQQQRTFQEQPHIPANDKDKFLIFLKEFKENLTHIHKNIIYLDYDFNTHIKWLDSAKSTANQIIYHELSRISCCEKEYVQVSLQYPNNIYLKNITSNRLAKISNRISVKAENYCRPKQRKVKSKVTISGQKLLKVFGMKRYLETIYTLQDIGNSTEHFVILHGLDLPSLKRNEVRIFKISTRHNNIKEWQGLTRHIGQQLKLYKFNNLRLLVTNGLIDHHPAVTIYHLNNTSQLFEIQQIIDGDYDIMEMIGMPNQQATKQLILSCSKCRRIFIYELNTTTTSGKYKILQIISLKSPVDKLVIFHLNNEYYMLVISQRQSSFYSIYKYAYIQGWLPLTFGYFPNLQMSIPVTDFWSKGNGSLRFSHGVPLILLCTSNDCCLVKAII